MAYKYFKAEKLGAFSQAAFEGFGFSPEDARIITGALIQADRYGIESHGVQRMIRYYKDIKDGLIKVGAKPEVVFQSPVSLVIDGHDGAGQLVSHFAMENCVKKAKTSGMCIATVRNSNHYGIASYYTKMATDAGMIGMAFTNSAAIMVPPNASKAMLGSNPIALAVPADPHPFIFDAASTIVTRGKIEMYSKAEKPIPDDWALDAHGVPTTDADEVLYDIRHEIGGGIMPLGGSSAHKGYGYAMICEIFSSILSQGLTSNHTNIDGVGGTCHGFVAIDLAAFGDPDEIKAHFSAFLQELRDAPKAEGVKRIYVAGDMEADRLVSTAEQGVRVDEKTIAEMRKIADYVGVDFGQYLDGAEIGD